MWNFIKALLPKPLPPAERFWRLIIDRVEKDAQLLGDFMELGNRYAAGSWAMMLLECEVVALRATAICVLASKNAGDTEALVKTFEARLTSWLQENRAKPLATFAAFTQTTVPGALADLTTRSRLYAAFFAGLDGNYSAEKLMDFIAFFQTRCVLAYTNKKLLDYIVDGETDFDRFIPKFVSAEIEMATVKAASVQPAEIAREITFTSYKPLGIVADGTSQPLVHETDIAKFRAGQLWAFHTPPDDANARIIILRVEDSGALGTIVHVAIVRIPEEEGKFVFAHLPFAESAVAKSVTKLESEFVPLPDFDEGYRLWREAFDADKGGVFTASVAEVYQQLSAAGGRTQ